LREREREMLRRRLQTTTTTRRGGGFLPTRGGLVLNVALFFVVSGLRRVEYVAAAGERRQRGEDDAPLWCEPENCYDLLEVHQHNATKALIKKQYFKFSRMYHPDKIGTTTSGESDKDDDDDENENENAGIEERRKEMTRKFAKLARAYEILSDERRRQDYDYALKYPEDRERNRAMFYRDKYSNQGMKASVTYILLGIVIVVTLFQFFNDRSVYRNVWLDFKASDVYAREMKTRLKKVNERRMMASVGGGGGKKKGGGGGGVGGGGSSSSLSTMNREDSNSSLNASTSGNNNSNNNKVHASKREKKKFLRNRSKEDEERDILDIEDEMRAQLVEQGVLSTPNWRNLAVVVVSKWAAKKAKELGAKAKAKARDLSKKKK
jgi:curved DNA-binding protein CbpA